MNIKECVPFSEYPPNEAKLGGGPTKTLRDEFAMAILPAAYEHVAKNKEKYRGLTAERAIAGCAYSMADAMLAEREKETP